MKGLFLFLLIIFTGYAYGAEFASTGARMCGYGYVRVNGNCVSWDSVPSVGCPVDFYVAPISGTSFLSVDSGRCPVSYTYTTSADLFPKYSGWLDSTGSPLCEYGYERINGTCERNESGSSERCPNGFYKTTATGVSFRAPNMGKCDVSYSFTTSDIVYPVYNGWLDSVGAPLSAEVLTPCPVTSLAGEYYVIPGDQFDVPTNAVCATNFTKYTIGQDCKNIGTGDIANNAICGVLCPNGNADSVYTNTGVCSTYCDALGGDVRINYMSSDGRRDSYPLYRDSLTTPALNIGFSDGSVCYGNMYSGGKSNTIQVKQGSTIYSIGN